MVETVKGASPKGKAKTGTAKKPDVRATRKPTAKKTAREDVKKAAAPHTKKTKDTVFPLNYIAKLDSKKRLAVRNARSEYYAVAELEGGILLLRPQEEFRLEDLPPEVIAMIDASSANFRAGLVSEPIDLD
jgi:hypothetical protein